MISRSIAPASALLLLLVLPSCSFSRSIFDSGPPKSSPAPPLRYVAVGASETVGIGADDPLRDAWPQVLYRTALPRSATFVNLGIPGATVEEALRREVPHAVRLDPNLVTVWLNVNDILAGVDPPSYEEDMQKLLSALRRDGATKVLVANTPPLDRLPAFVACQSDPPPNAEPCLFDDEVPEIDELNDLVAAYNEVIARVAAREGAVVVDLHAAAMSLRRAGREDEMVSSDGFHPSSLGHQVVARIFAAVLRRS